MARRSYDRMYKSYDPREDQTFEDKKEEKIEEPVKEEVKVEEPKKENKVIRGKVTGGLSLNVRNQPSTMGQIVNTLKDGEKVVIVDESYADWYKIQSPEGFVMRKFIEKI